jgi:hypothetical protein
MMLCPSCNEQQYDQTVNDAGACMACQSLSLLAEGRPIDQLPPHTVTEQGVNEMGQRFARLRYIDGSVDHIDPIPWNEPLVDTAQQPTTGRTLFPLSPRPMSPEQVSDTVAELDGQPANEVLVERLDKLSSELGFVLNRDDVRRNTMLDGAILFAELCNGEALRVRVS